MSEVEAFVDDTPGEVRGVVMRNGRFEHLLIQREDDVAQHRLGARSVGRVADAPVGLGGVFVDLGAGAPLGFLPLRKADRLAVGEKIQVEVTAEPRERKGPTLKLSGPGEGASRLLTPGPSVVEMLTRLAPGVTPQTGRDAVQASLEAEEAAGLSGELFGDTGLDMMVERTRAMVTVDLDWTSGPGLATGGKARDRANRQGLREAARAIRLKSWGGLVAIDLVGVGHDGALMTEAARQAFGTDPDIIYGPISRFGVLQLALPWRRTPLEELFNGPDRRRRIEHRAQDVARGLRLSLLSDTRIARVTARCAPEEAALAAPLVARLGPRAQLRPDPSVGPGVFIVDEG